MKNFEEIALVLFLLLTVTKIQDKIEILSKCWHNYDRAVGNFGNFLKLEKINLTFI